MDVWNPRVTQISDFAGTRWHLNKKAKRSDSPETRGFAFRGRSPTHNVGSKRPYTRESSAAVQTQMKEKERGWRTPCLREGRGEAVTQEMERERGRESALVGSGDRDGGGVRGGGGGSCSTGYESSSSVGTQVEYFSSFIAGGPLSASVIRSVCDAQSSLLQRKQVALPYSSNLLRGCRKKEMSMSGDEPASYISSPFIPSSLTCDYHTIDSPVKQLRNGGSHLFPSLLFIRKGKRFRSLVWSRCFLHFSVSQLNGRYYLSVQI